MTENLLIPQDYTLPTVEPCPKCGAVHWIHEEKGYGVDRMECLECHAVVWGFDGVLSHEPALATWNALSKDRQRLQAELDATKDKLAKAVEALEPFSKMAGELFALNYHIIDDVVMVGNEILDAEQFFKARAILAEIKEGVV